MWPTKTYRPTLYDFGAYQIFIIYIYVSHISMSILPRENIHFLKIITVINVNDNS